jgi:putative thioredoxin
MAYMKGEEFPTCEDRVMSNASKPPESASYGSASPYMSAKATFGTPSVSANHSSPTFTAPSSAVSSAMPSQPLDPSTLIKDTTSQTFRQDVLVESQKQPVIVDFWAPWCEPCKALEPALKKVVLAAKGRVKLVKLNIDEHPAIAGQLGIKSIPAVLAFEGGQPVDGFMGNIPESKIQAFMDQLIGVEGAAQIEEMLGEGDALLAANDLIGAAQCYTHVLMMDAQNLKAMGAMIRIQVLSGELESARRFLERVPEDKRNDIAIVAATAALELAEHASNVGDLAVLEAQVEQNPHDHQARFDLAIALNAKDKREEALDHLLIIVKKDRTWNDDGARQQIVQFFEAWGMMDEATIAGRRKLSTALYA